MTVSVRMDPLLEIELQQAAERQGVTKSQFIIAAVERALGRKNPYELMMTLKAEEPRAKYKATQQSYDSVTARATLRKRLKAKHDASGTG